MASTNVRVKKPQTLLHHINSLEGEAVREAIASGDKAIKSLRINGVIVQSTATPIKGRSGNLEGERVYRLFYMGGKRVSRNYLTDNLLASVSSMG